MVAIPINAERELFARAHQAFILRGLLAVALALLIFFMPGMALLTFVYAFGIYAVAEGISNIVAAASRTRERQAPWWALVLAGLVSIGAGMLAFFLPDLTAVALLYIIAGWAAVSGVLHLVAAIRLRKQISGEWLMVLSGVLSIVFGVLIAIYPGAGALAMILWIGAYAFVFGMLQIMLGFRIRRWTHNEPTAPRPGFPTAAPSR